MNIPIIVDSSTSIIDDPRLFNEMVNSPLDETFHFGRLMNIPAANVLIKHDRFIVELAIPGLAKNDIYLQLSGNVLTIAADKQVQEALEPGSRYARREYNYHTWSRSFTLPHDCKPRGITAKYYNGELTLDIPKAISVGTEDITYIEIQ